MNQIFISFIIYAIISVFDLGMTAEADKWWGQWHGPADGTACVEASAGGDLSMRWSVDLMDPGDNDSLIGNYGYSPVKVYKEGTLVRADDVSLYLKVNRDYIGAADNTVYKINPEDGSKVWMSTKSSGEDTSVARAFQLYDSPQGFRALHLASFYGTLWDTMNLEDGVKDNLFHDSHSCLGSRVLMGRWAWKNNRMKSPHSTSYYHGGRLLWWNGSSYVQKVDEDLALIDHAWDGSRCVLFVLSGYHGGDPYDQARYLVLDNEGQIVSDCAIDDIHRPDGSYNWRPVNTDIVMKLAIKGDYIYAIERKNSSETNLVRRKITDGFSLSGHLLLGNTSSCRGVSYCVTDEAVFVQYPLKITVYSTDLNNVLWETDTPKRTLHHSYIQGFDYNRYPGTRNYPSQTMATDSTYLYATTDNRLLVFRCSDGEPVYNYLFTDFPHKRTNDEHFAVVGKIGDLLLMRNSVVVLSCLDSSKIWCFQKAQTANRIPIIEEPDNIGLIVYKDNQISYKMRLTDGTGPCTWSINADTDDAIESLLSIDEYGRISGWTPSVSDIGESYDIFVTVSNAIGSDTVRLKVGVQNRPILQTILDMNDGKRMDVDGLDTFFGYNNKRGSYQGVKGAGRYFFQGDQIKFTFSNESSSSKRIYPQLSFRTQMKYTDAIIKYIPLGYVYLPAHSTVSKSFVIREVYVGYHNFVSIYHSGVNLDKIEISAPLLLPENIIPVAVVSVPDYVFVNQAMNLDGSNSYDLDGLFIKGYEWDFGDLSPVENEAVVTHTYLEVGEFDLKLRVMDADNDWSLWTESTVSVLLPYADDDNDGLNNTDEIAHGTDPFMYDSDADGMSDGQEVDVGTDPKDKRSYFAILDSRIEPVFSGVKITWTSLPEWVNLKIFWKDDISNEWQEVSYDGFESDIVDNPDGSKSWIDRGVSVNMNGVAPMDSSFRIYKVVAGGDLN